MSLLRQLVLVILPLLAKTQSSFLDNQQCYFGAGELASAEFIPCYTSWSREPTSCCKRGNVCLEHNACYDSATGNTYQSGCTDETYEHANCPSKCGLDTKKSSWIGLVYCNGSDGTPDNTWICNHPDNCNASTPCPNAPWDPLLQKLPPNAKCSDMNTNLKAISAPGTLSDIFTIPATAMSSYFAAHPTTQSVSLASGGTVVTQAVVSTIWRSTGPTPSSAKPERTSDTPSTSPSFRSQNNVNTTALGLGIGIPLVLAILSATVFFLFRRRRRRGTKNDINTNVPISVKGSPVAPDDKESGYVFKAELPANSWKVNYQPVDLSYSGMDCATDGRELGGQKVRAYELEG